MTDRRWYYPKLSRTDDQENRNQPEYRFFMCCNGGKQEGNA
ncbi:hypothetical protein [Spirosoma endophyticum]|nr:hypothetical protein [Spirosoma endophyticum]